MFIMKKVKNGRNGTTKPQKYSNICIKGEVQELGNIRSSHHQVNNEEEQRKMSNYRKR